MAIRVTALGLLTAAAALASCCAGAWSFVYFLKKRKK
jgi:hypothetical protein